MSNHISTIKTWKNTSIARHFITHGHDIDIHFKIGIIDQISGDVSQLRIREGFWIYQLQTVTKGINEKEEANDIMDYQIINYTKHFRHSKSCTPYMIHTLKSMFTDQLKPYRRCILKPRKRVSASAFSNDADQRRSRPDLTRWLAGYVAVQRNRTAASDVDHDTVV
jgi:hypothetical protein